MTQVRILFKQLNKGMKAVDIGQYGDMLGAGDDLAELLDKMKEIEKGMFFISRKSSIFKKISMNGVPIYSSCNGVHEHV